MRIRMLVLSVGLSLILTVTAALAATPQPVVRAVLFWADGCGHCHVVIEKSLAPLQRQYGSQLQIAMIEVSGENYAYFRQVEEAARLPAERRGVPALFIADRILVGSQEIPAELPGLIQRYLAAGGVDYPALPGLAERLAQTAVDLATLSAATPVPAVAPSGVGMVAAAFGPAEEVGTAEAPRSQGFELATAVAVLLVLALLYALAALVAVGSGRSLPMLPESLNWLIPVLGVIGLGVAGYLTFVETQNVRAICGPVGDCNAVQASPYARLFGVVPVGLLGLAGYVAIVAAWLVGRRSSGALAAYAAIAVLAMALFGVLFSLYLTYIELAVILAVCIWCLTSAVIMALILILAVGPALAVFQGEEAAESGYGRGQGES